LSRKKLKEIEEYRGTFTGTFKRKGEKSGYKGYPETTILLINVRGENGVIVADHLWFNYTKGFRELNLTVGDTVQFDARVKRYYKGYQGFREEVPLHRERDYKLSHPTKISIIEESVTKLLGFLESEG